MFSNGNRPDRGKPTSPSQNSHGSAISAPNQLAALPRKYGIAPSPPPASSAALAGSRFQTA